MLEASKKWSPSWALVAVAILVFTLGCGPSEDEQAGQARSEEWSALQTMKAELTEKRQELSALGDRLAADIDAAQLPDGQTVEDAMAEIKTQYGQLEAEVEATTEQFGQRLVNFINDEEIERGAEPTEAQLAALRLKAGEDLLIADEYGEKGGDWARAIAITEELQRTDPGNTEVQERLEFYRSMRYMSEERFASAEVGMTLDQVTKAVGVPSRGNDRPFGDDRRGFFYLKGEDRSAAAVYFQKKDNQWIAYKVDYNAIEGAGGSE